jgi:hypothetical protein
MSANFSLLLVMPLVLWGVYLVNDIFLSENSDSRAKLALHWLNYGILIWFISVAFKFEQTPIGATILIIGLIYAACAWFLKSKAYLHCFLGAVFMSTFSLLSGSARVGAWAVEAVLLIWAAKKFDIKIEKWGLTFLGASLVFVLGAKEAMWVDNIDTYLPVFNSRTLFFIFPMIAGFICSKILENQNEALSRVLKFFWISLLYLFAVLEINLILVKFGSFNNNLALTQTMTTIIIMLIYAINTKRLAIVTKFKLFDVAGCLLFALALSVLFFAAFAPVQNLLPVFNIRVIAFVAAICVSLLYAKWHEADSHKDLFKYTAIILGFFLLHHEVAAYNSSAWLSVTYLLYSGALMLTGTFNKAKTLKMAGIWITIIAILKIVFIDLAHADAIFKVLAFLTLGVILMIVSYFYTKKNKEQG